MFIEFITKHSNNVCIDINKIVYFYPGPNDTTWIVFGHNDFEILVQHPYSYVTQQISFYLK